MPRRELSSDWLTVTETLKYGAFSRSRLYKLFGEGLIKTFSLRSRGSVKGKRYVSKQSLDEYFNTQCKSQMNSPEWEASEARAIFEQGVDEKVKPFIEKEAVRYLNACQATPEDIARHLKFVAKYGWCVG